MVTTQSTRADRLRARAIVLALLLLGTALRMVDIGTHPPGLYHDEAQHGMDALAVLEGRPAFYFVANNGREPLFIYLVTAAVAVLGRTPLAIRLPSTYVGILTLAACYDLGRSLWGRRAGRWALAVLTVTFWHVHLSRMGFRAVLLPLFTALALSQAAKGLSAPGRRAPGRRAHGRQSRHVGTGIGHWIAAGVLYGASWYTYMAARFTPIAISTLLIYGWLWHGDVLRRQWKQMLAAAGAALLVLLPLGIFTLRHPEIVLARSGQVSIFSAEIHHGRFWATLGNHILRTVGMFTTRGDRIWRHNLAWRPVWDPALSVAFLIGVGVALSLLRRTGCRSQPGAAVALAWTGVMAVPTLLAEDAPHFLRGVGVLPTAALLPALGLLWIETRTASYAGRLSQSLPRARTATVGDKCLCAFRGLLRLLPVLCVGVGLVSTTYDYFVRYRAAPLAYHWLEGGPVALAAEINKLRGEGWNGNRMLRDATTQTAPTVFIEPQLWAEWKAVPFLLPASAINDLPTEQRLRADEAAVFAVWPYQAWEKDVLPVLAHPTYVQVRRGPEAQGDLDPEPYSIATLVEAGPLPEVPPALASFEHGIVLRAALVETGEETAVNLWWEATTSIPVDCTVFVHYLRGDQRIAQHDGPPGLGHLVTTQWHPGDLILDRHPLGDVVPTPHQDRLRLGLYDSNTGENLRLLAPRQGGEVDAATGDAESYAIELPVIPTRP